MGDIRCNLNSRLAPVELEEKAELIRSDSSLPENGPQRSRVQFRMIRYNDLCKGIASAKDDMAAVLPSDFKP